MPPPVISVEGLGKRYTLSHQKRQDTLRDSLTQGVRALFAGIRGGARDDKEDFWALRDVSFEINQGDVVGIIGRNGAGKSTLLKILSRITEPTTGRAVIRGRVASLLEVGTGFHPELSGRENIFLNGAILGMSREEIARKFDEIVAFAEVERFLDTQVKHYSSGMYVRLAFAVAAHLEPEILIVDEVLAVGDAQFQKKCLGKMNDVARNSGRTVLFVSHNTAALQAICRRGLWLNNGHVMQSGNIGECLSGYLASGSEASTYVATNPAKPHITSVSLDRSALTQGRFRVSVGFKSPTSMGRPVVGVTIFSKLGQPLAGSNGRMLGEQWTPPELSQGVVTAEIDLLPLHSDTYRVSVYLGDATQDYDQKLDAVEFDYISPHFYPQCPPLHIIGQVDLAWKWSIATSAPPTK
jgi:lipopolysaccharide transport system ATP-binding protein